ncbi:MAG: serine--tRNA ligase [Armatimonadota bacterium]|nr:MAG: serine--tRNA ligase [Armatimonadota bacterium]
MLDLKFIRDNPDEVREALKKLHEDAPIDDLLAADEKRRALLTEVEKLRQQVNERSQQVARAEAGERARLIAYSRDLGDRISELEDDLREVEAQLDEQLLLVPNMPHPNVPVGDSEADNVIVRTWGEPRALDFAPKPHWELGEELGIIDFERGVKVSGTRFYVLRGLGARLQRALITFMLDVHVNDHGYTEIYPPYMVRRECMEGTGNLPKFADNLYHDDEDDMWFIPTAEVPVTNLFRDEILEAAQLPLRHVAYSANFRREKMAAGRDTRGLKRGHQFDKVELVKHVAPETSDEELQKLIADAEDILQRLELPYRVNQMCTADLSFVAAIKYDLDVWAPGVEEWLECSSCSSFGDFQARRMNIRYRPRARARPQFVHTLNGSGIALPRTMIAVMENYQQPDGSIRVPQALVPYMGGVEVIGP